MYYQLLIKGIDHETSSGRAPLPRSLQVWKDLEEAGADKLLMAKLSDRLKQAAKITYDGKLVLDELYAIDSKKNAFLQVADLLASSANRVLNRTSSKRNHKDNFADYLLERVGIDPTLSPNVELGDKAVYIAL